MNAISRAVQRCSDAALDLAIPRTCLACDDWMPGRGGELCGACHAALAGLTSRPCCPRCARTADPATVYNGGCGQCRREHFWNLRGVARIGTYEGPLKNMVRTLKYQRSVGIAGFLARLLAEAVQRQHWPTRIDALIPVPMHWLRRQQRPVDHALELAEALGRVLHIPARRAVVRRARYGVSQTSFGSTRSRFLNVRDCFRPAWRARLQGANVCIVDNLISSGATVHELSRVLRACGARNIYAAVAGRSDAPPDAAFERSAAWASSLSAGGARFSRQTEECDA